jgi:hypothetical protein
MDTHTPALVAGVLISDARVLAVSVDAVHNQFLIRLMFCAISQKPPTFRIQTPFMTWAEFHRNQNWPKVRVSCQGKAVTSELPSSRT